MPFLERLSHEDNQHILKQIYELYFGLDTARLSSTARMSGLLQLFGLQVHWRDMNH